METFIYLTTRIISVCCMAVIACTATPLAGLLKCAEAKS
ncbi:hypothetical protein FHW89_002891 [Mucilaginibacter sp. SG564]|nr:hypothetical protein [Mucilaginibacter sp. SG564]